MKDDIYIAFIAPKDVEDKEGFVDKLLAEHLGWNNKLNCVNQIEGTEDKMEDTVAVSSKEVKFCNVCGKELETIPVSSYDCITGMQNTIKKCPTNECNHYGCGYHEYKQVILKQLHKEKCERCGVVL